MIETAVKNDAEGDILLADMGQGFGFRTGMFDGVRECIGACDSTSASSSCDTGHAGAVVVSTPAVASSSSSISSPPSLLSIVLSTSAGRNRLAPRLYRRWRLREADPADPRKRIRQIFAAAAGTGLMPWRALAKTVEKPYQRRLPATYPAGSERGRSSGVEHDLAKVGVEGSNPFARSIFHHDDDAKTAASAGAVRRLRLASRALCGTMRGALGNGDSDGRDGD